MKKWVRKHKGLLIGFVIASVVVSFITAIQLHVLLDNVADLQYYVQTGEVTASMYQYSIICFVNLIVAIIWIVLLFLLIWKVIFPNVTTVKNAFFLGELAFLIKMPASIRKELRRKNEQ